MATATGDIAVDFSGLGDVNPYTNVDFTAGNNNFNITSGSLRPVTVETVGLFLYTDSNPTDSTIRSKIEINHSSAVANDIIGAAIADTSGNGYAAVVNGTELYIYELTAYAFVTLASKGGVSYSSLDIIELDLNTGTGALEAFIGGVSELTTTDTTFSSNLKAGVYGRWDNTNAHGAVSFAADGYAASGVSITSVTDPIVSGSSFTITGSGFEASQGTGTVTVGGESATVSAWSDTSITASIDIESSSAKYGANDVVVTNDSAESDTQAAHTVNPPANNAYVDLSGTLATSGDRLTAILDLAAGDQVRYESVLYSGATPTAYTVSVVVNALFTAGNSPADGTYTFECRVWDSGDQTWGTAADQTVTIGVVVGGGAIQSIRVVSDSVKKTVKNTVR